VDPMIESTPANSGMESRAAQSHGSVYRGLRGLLVKNPRAGRFDLAGKRMLVTGASPGSLGFETALTLASWGADVVITTRKKPEATVDALRNRLNDEAAGARIEGFCLDLSITESVETFAKQVLEQSDDRLDVLINNAGVHLDLLSRWKEPRLSDDGFELHWRTNYLGTAHLTHRLMPALQATAKAVGDARVVNVVSWLHTRGTNKELFEQTRPYDSWNAYGQSKLALIHMSNELERRMGERYGVHANCLHPGSVFTNVADKGLAEAGLLGKFRNRLSPVEAFFLKTPDEGAQTQILCATQPGLDGGHYYDGCQPVQPGPEASAPEVAQRLWDETEAWVGADPGAFKARSS
jgi:retinol dehydrogenase-12